MTPTANSVKHRSTPNHKVHNEARKWSHGKTRLTSLVESTFARALYCPCEDDLVQVISLKDKGNICCSVWTKGFELIIGFAVHWSYEDKLQ